MQPWIQAILATILISVAPVIFLPFVPLQPQHQQNRLKILLSFAVGGLLGDVFLHLIPHSLFPHPPHAHNPPSPLPNQPLFDPSHNTEHSKLDDLHLHDHEHSTGKHDSSDHHHPHTFDDHTHSSEEHDSHEHHHTEHIHLAGEQNNEHHHHHDHNHHDHNQQHAGDNVFENPHDHHQIMKIGLSILLGILVFFLVEKYLRSRSSVGGHGHSHNPKEEKKGKKKKTEKSTTSVKVGGYLNLVADFLHNFTDGLAIATSFLTHPSVGFSTTVAVLFHELPHEMGDFAILIQSGFTRKQAIFAQLLTAIGALLGTFGGILISQALKSASPYILAFTSGGFIYIATVGVIPVLLESTDFYQTLKEVMGMLCGTALMVVVGLYFESH